MNAHPEFASVASPQMQAGLLDAVRGKTSNAGPDDRLIDLYASILSSPSLVEAFRALPKQYSKRQVEVEFWTVPETDPSVTPVAKREDYIDQYAKRQVEVYTRPGAEPRPTSVDKREANVDLNQIVSRAGHVAVSSACVALFDRIRMDTSWKSGAPRNICHMDAASAGA
ncbi:hypothetical protein CNMCM5793_005815 [Aspergillus hiratsukae]|uniref:Uncharacterized protein n=1 Tax=Aspergillus hiratsukae TaxID=1194566 RepID=A0A8H6PGI0_9EURO|nr:hypothetical protein CNMCM5793_005815 [Aspergillus hiratsukae]KAF7172260.1 hypothetical protein CNMCM6106_006496 [Aspergillus hiratsukae]